MRYTAITSNDNRHMLEKERKADQQTTNISISDIYINFPVEPTQAKLLCCVISLLALDPNSVSLRFVALHPT
jgi:hypothetical protein